MKNIFVALQRKLAERYRTRERDSRFTGSSDTTTNDDNGKWERETNLGKQSMRRKVTDHIMHCKVEAFSTLCKIIKG